MGESVGKIYNTNDFILCSPLLVPRLARVKPASHPGQGSPTRRIFTESWVFSLHTNLYTMVHYRAVSHIAKKFNKSLSLKSTACFQIYFRLISLSLPYPVPIVQQKKKCENYAWSVHNGTYWQTSDEMSLRDAARSWVSFSSSNEIRARLSRVLFSTVLIIRFHLTSELLCGSSGQGETVTRNHLDICVKSSETLLINRQQ